MFVTPDQLLAHAVGDYVLQSDWMAVEKTKHRAVALVHALAYSLPFLLLHPSLNAWVLIVLTHALIDHYRFARYVVYAKEWLFDPRALLWLYGEQWRLRVGARFGLESPWKDSPHPKPFVECPTGYDPDKPAWLAVWLLIITDNVMHVLINAYAFRYLP